MSTSQADTDNFRIAVAGVRPRSPTRSFGRCRRRRRRNLDALACCPLLPVTSGFIRRTIAANRPLAWPNSGNLGASFVDRTGYRRITFEPRRSQGRPTSIRDVSRLARRHLKWTREVKPRSVRKFKRFPPNGPRLRLHPQFRRRSTGPASSGEVSSTAGSSSFNDAAMQALTATIHGPD